MEETTIEGVGSYKTSVGDLANNVRELGGRLISMRDEAYLRILTAGKQNVGKTDGTRVSMIVNYLKGENPIFVKQKIFPLRLAEQLVQANSQGRYFSTEDAREYEKASKIAKREVKHGIEPAKRTAIILPSRAGFSMSPNLNKQHYEFVFEDMSNSCEERISYFQLNNGDIDFFLIDASTIDSVNGTTRNYLWFGRLDDRSELLGSRRLALSCYDGVRGVFKETSEAGSRKISAPTKLTYTQRQANEWTKTLSGVRSGSLPASKLEELIQIFSQKQ